jgi:hypothetical protein
MAETERKRKRRSIGFLECSSLAIAMMEHDENGSPVGFFSPEFSMELAGILVFSGNGDALCERNIVIVGVAVEIVSAGMVRHHRSPGPPSSE